MKRDIYLSVVNVCACLGRDTHRRRSRKGDVQRSTLGGQVDGIARIGRDKSACADESGGYRELRDAVHQIFVVYGAADTAVEQDGARRGNRARALYASCNSYTQTLTNLCVGGGNCRSGWCRVAAAAAATATPATNRKAQETEYGEPERQPQESTPVGQKQHRERRRNQERSERPPAGRTSWSVRIFIQADREEECT